MNKARTLHQQVGHTLQVLMMTLVCLLCGIPTAWAEGTGTIENPYVLTGLTPEGSAFKATGYKLYATLTPETDGILVFTCNYSQFTDNTFATQSETQPSWDGKWPQEYKLPCAAGTTYYVGGFMQSSEVTIKFLTEDEDLMLSTYTPENGSVFDVVAGTVNLEFNKMVKIESCVMSYGSMTSRPEIHITNAYASVNVRDLLIAAYDNGTLRKGDNIKFTFSGITSLEDGSLLNGTGIFEVTYKAPAKPMYLVSSVHTPTAEKPVTDFKSYYMRSDSTAIVQLTFSEKIGSVGDIQLIYGNPEGSGEDDGNKPYYEETLTPVVKDNIIEIDLSGKRRLPGDMLTEAEVFDNIALKVSNVKDTNGNMAYSSGIGTLGTFFFTYKYKQIEYSATADWTLVGGEVITTDTKAIELWLMETGDTITFTGVKFAYKDKGVDKNVVVRTGELTITDDEEYPNARIITIPIPGMKADEGTITVSLEGVETPDGIEHAADYTHEFACATIVGTGTGTKGDPYTLQDLTPEGKEYKTIGYRLYAEFTPDSDGILIFPGNFTQYTDGTFETQSATQPKWDGKYPQQYKLQCTAGTTYYLGGYMSSSVITIKYLDEEEPLKVTAFSPADGSIFDVVRGSVNLEFNQKVSITRCIMNYGRLTYNPSVFTNNAYASVDVKEQLIAAYNNGSLREGDDIKFTFSGIKSLEDGKLLNGTGVFEVSYKAPAKPMVCVSSENTPTSTTSQVLNFKSYYMKNDPTGIVKLTFSGEVGSVGSVQVIYGDIEGSGEDDAASQYYVEDLTAKINGNTVEIDLRGKLRRHKDMVEVETFYEDITLKIANVKDANGNMAYSSGIGTLGSFFFGYKLKEVKYTATTDWTDTNGNDITGDTKEIELWLLETGGKATFTGVKFAYKENGADKETIVPASELTIADDEEFADAKLITIPVPAVKMDAGTVKISLDGVESPDGVDHEDYTYEFINNTDAIDHIVADADGIVDVYTIDGICVLRNADAAAVKNLRNGLYVINGKKVVVKK